MDKFNLRSLTPVLIHFGKQILLAVLVYFIGSRLIRWFLSALEKSFRRSNMDAGLRIFLHGVIKTILYISIFIIVVGIFGVKSTSLAALVGSAGLTMGLALQGSLANFAGGVLILLMKPFRIGDYIIAVNNEGTVQAIDIFYTRLLTIDNRMVVIPNGTLTNSNITNVTSEPIRRLDLTVSIAYSESIDKVKGILTELVMVHPLVLKDRENQVFVSSFDPSAITMGIRIWVLTEEYWNLKWNLLEQIKHEFDKNNVTIPFSQLDVNVTKKEYSMRKDTV